ncbi:MAG: hypothetical protein JSR77_00625 [Planctomycetes bacterium]|nr:hypothetical protein [Planctomycetota bacterium]
MTNSLPRFCAKSATLSVLMATLMTGCSSYYKVTDPASGKEYYTKDVDRSGRGGAVEFKDARTNAEVTLVSSEVLKIDKKAFEAATKK